MNRVMGIVAAALLPWTAADAQAQTEPLQQRVEAILHAAGQGPGFALTYASGAVRLFGELDASSAAEFQRLLDAVLAATTGVLEVDLDRLDFIDVSASRVLAEARQTMACANRDLQLTGVRRAAVLPLAAFNLHGGAPR